MNLSENIRKINEKHFTLIAHYYRAEIHRETTWRSRLDVTTNWSIVVTAAISSFSLGSKDIPHVIILANFLFVLFFLYSESRRFRYYMILKERTRWIEKYLLSYVFNPDEDSRHAKVDWNNKLSESLKTPTVSMSRLESVSWRLRRNYVFLLIYILFIWLTKISMHPVRAGNFWQVVENAEVLFIPGEVVIVLMPLSVIFLIVLAYYVSKASETVDLP